MSLLDNYAALKSKHQLVYDRLKKQFNLLSTLRLVIILAILIIIYFLIVKTTSYFLFAALFALVISFFVVLNLHANLVFKLSIAKELIKINEDEISFLKGEDVSIENGEKYLDPKHMYSFDIDIFGHKSLFQYLNRTATFIGESSLANLLKKKSENEEISLTQEAVKELVSKVDWRQNLLAFARVSQDDNEKYNHLMQWLKKDSFKIPKWLQIISFVLPAIFIIIAILYFATDDNFYFEILYKVFLANMFLTFSQFKKMKNELSYISHIEDIVKSYSLIIDKIETQDFSSSKLKALKSKLNVDGVLASHKIKELSKIFSKTASLLNAFGSTLLNGLFMYHIHAFRNLDKWKTKHASEIEDWVNVIGSFEAINSFANFSFNNPSFTFPELNSDKAINFKNLGHPLLNETQRINNDMSFSDHRFVILTGSNMSGKSTFLRSLGVNMVLAGAGAPVCATEANVHPMQILVSMRLMDSLDENESYFFAEVKRLKAIMDLLESETSFVILDEILRGTNSDDKRQGTIEVIKQMISKKAIGIIATHDLEVCNTTKEYPEVLSNKCFEVEIVENDLSFDYKLRDGICKNKSASFLMKKMKVI